MHWASLPFVHLFHCECSPREWRSALPKTESSAHDFLTFINLYTSLDPSGPTSRCIKMSSVDVNWISRPKSCVAERFLIDPVCSRLETGYGVENKMVYVCYDCGVAKWSINTGYEIAVRVIHLSFTRSNLKGEKKKLTKLKKITQHYIDG